MSTNPNPFQPRGNCSRVAACLDIIQALEPDQDIAKAYAVAEVSERTGMDETEHAVSAAMREASERLIADGVPGVRNVRRFGWVRMTHEDLIQRYGAEREKRGRRQFRRLGRAAAAADPEQLTGEARLKRDFQIHAAARLAELEGRRAQRLRPRLLASGE